MIDALLAGLTRRVEALEKIIRRQPAVEVDYTGGGGAPSNAQYVLVANDGTLPNDRQLANGTNTVVTDGGAGGDLSIDVSPQGSGSGLDADTLDGSHLSEVVKKTEVGTGISFGSTLDLDINELTETTSPDSADMVALYDDDAGAIRKQSRNNFLSGTTAAQASETAQGVIELATQAEVNTGTDTERAVVPATLANYTGIASKAPNDAQFVTLAADGDLSDERILTAGQNMYITDGGAGSTVTIDNVIKAKNTSGGTANANDVGYIDEAGEYKTDGTAFADHTGDVAVVIVGGANNATIYVAMAGRVTVAYDTGGNTPDGTTNKYLYFSGTAGDLTAYSYMRPEVVALVPAGVTGSAGTVDALLLPNTNFVGVTSSNSIFANVAMSDTLFTGTINGAPTPTSVVYTPATGAEDVLTPAAAGELSKMRLWNITRGTYRLITACDTGTNTITTVSSSDTWANGDSITITSQTTTQGGAWDFIEMDLSQQSEIPELARELKFEILKQESGTSLVTALLHPYEAFSSSKAIGIMHPGAANGRSYRTIDIPLIDNVFCMASDASGTGTSLIVLKLMGCEVATP